MWLLLACVDPASAPSSAETGDSSGDLLPLVELPAPITYVTERYEGTLFALDRDTMAVKWALDGHPAVVGLAVDARGYIYLAATDNDDVGSLLRVSPDGTTTETLVPADGTLLRPQGLWYDASTDTVLLADVNAATIYEVDLTTFALTSLTTNVATPSDAARRPGESTMYVTARDEGAVYAVDSATGAASVVATGVPDVHSLVPGPNGVLYVMVTGQRALVQVDQNTGAVETLITDFGYAPAVGVCLDTVPDRLMLTDHGGHTMYRFTPSTREIEQVFQDEWDLYECGHNQPPDADGDGAFSFAVAGTDVDDTDPNRQ